MKIQKKLIFLVPVLFASFVYYYVSYNKHKTGTVLQTSNTTTSTPDARREISATPEQDITTRQQRDIVTFTDTVISSLRAKDFKGFAQHIHPTKGLRVSLYQYFDTQSGGDTVFFANGNEFVAQTVSSTPRIWGHADGSGNPVQLTFSQFYTDWLYEHDYLHAPNVRVFRTYTSVTDAYPAARVVLYEYPGFDAKFEGMDWSGLVVGIEEYNGEWYVVVLTHAQWMI